MRWGGREEMRREGRDEEGGREEMMGREGRDEMGGKR